MNKASCTVVFPTLRGAVTPALCTSQHGVPHTVLRLHRGQQLLGCDPPAPSAVGFGGAQRAGLVPGHHHRRHPRSVQGHGEREARKEQVALVVGKRK